MEFGVGIFPAHDGIRPDAVARLVEERGHESLFFPDHTHMPAEHSPYPGLPRKSWHTFELFVAVTAAVTATTRLRVGTGVCLVIQRDPIITAKEVASVDHLSGVDGLRRGKWAGHASVRRGRHWQRDQRSRRGGRAQPRGVGRAGARGKPGARRGDPDGRAHRGGIPA